MAGIQVAMMIPAMTNTSSELIRIIRPSLARAVFMLDDVGDDFLLDHDADFIN
jgi:hypothetical protein